MQNTKNIFLQNIKFTTENILKLNFRVYSILKVSLFIFFMTFAVLYFFQPFNIQHGHQLLGLVRIFSYALIVSGVFYLLEIYIKQVFEKSLIYPYSYLIWYPLELLLITISIFLCKNIWLGFNYFSFNQYFIILFKILSIVAFFLFMIFLALYFLRSKKKNEIIFKSNDTNPEYFHTNIEHIRVLTNEKNYTTIYCFQDGKLINQTLRGSLSFFEKQVTLPLFRIHRSYIINIEKIEQITGNSQGRTITLQNTDRKFTVSRKYLKVFDKLWREMIN